MNMDPSGARPLSSGRALCLTTGAGQQVAWRIWGDGPAVVLLHGGFGSWTHWLRNIEPLARSYRVLAPDLPGLGASGDIPADTTSTDIARMVIGTLDRMDDPPARFAIVGFSFGAIIGGAIAALAGDRVTRLVLVGASGLGAVRPPPARSMVKWRHLRDPAQVQAAHRANLGLHMIHDPARIDATAIRLQTENTRQARFRSRGLANGCHLRDALRPGSAPIAAIWGECDSTAAGHLEERRAILAAIDPGVEFVIVPQAGHWVQFERAEEVNRHLLALLASDRSRERTDA